MNAPNLLATQEQKPVSEALTINISNISNLNIELVKTLIKSLKPMMIEALANNFTRIAPAI